MWLEPSVTALRPALLASSGPTRGSMLNTMPVLCWVQVEIIGHSKSLTLTSLSEMRALTRPALPVRDRIGTGQSQALVLKPR